MTLGEVFSNQSLIVIVAYSNRKRAGVPCPTAAKANMHLNRPREKKEESIVSSSIPLGFSICITLVKVHGKSNLPQCAASVPRKTMKVLV